MKKNIKMRTCIHFTAVMPDFFDQFSLIFFTEKQIDQRLGWTDRKLWLFCHLIYGFSHFDILLHSSYNHPTYDVCFVHIVFTRIYVSLFGLSITIPFRTYGKMRTKEIVGFDLFLGMLYLYGVILLLLFFFPPSPFTA